MFDFVQNNKSVQLGMKILLGVISLTFVLFGIGDYNSMSNDANEVVKVGDTPIMRYQVERELEMRNLGPDKFEDALNSLIQRRLLLEQARSAGLSVSTQDLKNAIAALPAFQKDGQFSPELYQKYLQNNQISTTDFENERRNELLLQQMGEQLMGNGFVSKAVSERLSQFLTKQRDVSQFRFEPTTYLGQVKITEQDVQAYYKGHAAEFTVPEQIKVEYVLLSAKAIAAGQTVTDPEIKTYFDANKNKYEHEERQASHILLMIPEKADAAAKDAVKAQAEKIHAELQKNPGQFAALATQYSQDPGSAQRGGDLGWMSAEGLDKSFAAALFAMKAKEISGLVQSQFGYHIIQLNGIKKVGLEEAKSAIVEKLKEQKARQQFPELADKLADLVVDNEKNLAPVAAGLKQPLQSTNWMGRSGQAGDALFSNKDVLEKLFTADSLSGRATDVIELPEQQRLVARVVARQPEHLQAVADVSAAIKAKLEQQAAAKLAAADGQKQLAALQKDPGLALVWGAVQPVSLQQPGSLSRDAIKQAFALPAKAGDQFVGIAERDGFTLLKVGKETLLPVDPRMTQQLEQVQLMGEGDAYLKALQREIKVLRKPVAAKTDGNS